MTPFWPAATRHTPLDPSGDRARSLLRHELLHPAYQQQDPLQRFLAWLQDTIGSGLQRASEVSPLTTLGAMLVFALLLLGLGVVLSRVRRTAAAPGRAGAVLSAEVVTAAELRARAEAALASGRAGEAVVEGFRALTLRELELGRITDHPEATAHEVADALVRLHPTLSGPVLRAAGLFDLVRYGDRPATAAQARDVLDLGDALAGVR